MNKNIFKTKFKLLLGFIFIFLILTLFFGRSIIASNIFNTLEDKYIYVYTVKERDTLWSISKEFNNDKNINQLIYDIVEINNIKNNNIYQGDKILIPIRVKQ